MKKLIGCFMAMALLSAAFVIGSGCSSPSSGPTGPAGTPTNTRTPTNSPTPTSTPTPQAAQATVNLGSAANYGVLAYAAITNSGASTICGSLGIAPLSSVDGGIVLTCGGVRDVDNTAANTAKLDLSTAYTNAAGRTGGASIPAGANIGGRTFYRGLYTCGGNLSISSGDLTLDGQGDPTAVFIFQVSGNMNVTSGRHVFLVNGANAANVFWQTTGFCSLGTTVSFAGTIMAYTSVTMNTGATLQGRALAENGNVTLLSNTIINPTP